MIRQVLPLATSALTVVSMWRAGSGRPDAWAIGLANQVLWLLTIVLFGVWGLLPLTVILTVTYARNWARWKQATS